MARDLIGQAFTVIGAAGFVGQRLTAALHARGAQVFAPKRDDPALWQKPLGHVMYCAGLTADYLARPFDTVQAHVSLLAQVLQRAHWQTLVYLSSTRVYDSLGGVDACETAVLQVDPANPRHLYDLSKALGEALCHTTGQGRARVARLACVYDSPADPDGFLSTLLRQVRAAQVTGVTRIEVASSPFVERDYVHVSDVVDGLIRIAIRGQHTVYNLAGGEKISNAALFAYLEHRWKCQVLPLQQTAPAIAAPLVRIDRMREEFGWQPRALFDVLDQWRGIPTC